MIPVLQHPFIKVTIVCLAMAIFSFFIHHPFPFRLLSFTAIIAVAMVIAKDRNIFETVIPQRSVHLKSAWMVIGAVASYITAREFRNDADLPILISRLTSFASVAVLIGTLEELLFRGWMLSQFKRSIWIGVLVTSIAHASYKALLFSSPHMTYSIDALYLFVLTFRAGLFLGLSRVVSGSIWPAIIAHALFDILIYGDQSAPWWVF
jgi:membrane protease YdiL (CAAX protease family)